MTAQQLVMANLATLPLLMRLPDNRPPTIDAINAPVDPVALSDQPLSVEVIFSDPDAGDVHEVTWAWGDGKSDTQAGATSPATAGHTYDEPGVYRVTVTVTDAAGEWDRQAYEFIVVYDPRGGFVTGGGWTWSPAGAYADDLDLEGKASFGFVSKYKKGAKVPDGQTQFQFKAGSLNFLSDSYQWLVVTGAKAMFKGMGTVNGARSYGFMLSATDAALSPNTDLDLFRIKIWDLDGGNVVYDNLMGADDDEDPTTAIGGGNIVVHKAK
jgi:PKD repeat protein